MPDIRIHRAHQLGLTTARSVAHTWARKAEAKFGLACTYEEGAEHDVLHFSRAGVQGTLQVQADRFDLVAQLGFLWGAFQGRIEEEIGAQLDKLLNAPPRLLDGAAAQAAPLASAAAPASEESEGSGTPAGPAAAPTPTRAPQPPAAPKPPRKGRSA